MGELGLSPKEFNEMQWDEYCYASHGYFIRQAREWERTRFVSWMIYNANAKNAKKSPADLFPLLTDRVDGEEVKRESPVAYAERWRKAKEFENVLNTRGIKKKDGSST